MGEQVHDFYGAFAKAHDDGLPFIEHAEGINRVKVVLFPKNLAVLVDVDQFLKLPWGYGNVEESVDDRAHFEDLLRLPFELEFLCVLDEHARIIIRLINK